MLHKSARPPHSPTSRDQQLREVGFYLPMSRGGSTIHRLDIITCRGGSTVDAWDFFLVGAGQPWSLAILRWLDTFHPGQTGLPKTRPHDESRQLTSGSQPGSVCFVETMIGNLSTTVTSQTRPYTRPAPTRDSTYPTNPQNIGR